MRRNSSLIIKSRCYGRDEELSMPSLVEVWKGADYQEREVWDLMGIRFEGHPNHKRIMLWEGFPGHPLRKDFPLTGHTEVRYSEDKKQIVSEKVKLDQQYRDFDFESPWEGTKYIKEQSKK